MDDTDNAAVSNYVHNFQKTGRRESSNELLAVASPFIAPLLGPAAGIAMTQLATDLDKDADKAGE